MYPFRNKVSYLYKRVGYIGTLFFILLYGLETMSIVTFLLKIEVL